MPDNGIDRPIMIHRSNIYRLPDPGHRATAWRTMIHVGIILVIIITSLVLAVTGVN